MAEEESTGGMIERLRNSPRTVSTIIVILIIAGAIFAFSDRQQRTTPSPNGEQSKEVGTTPKPSPTAGAEETSAASEKKDEPKDTARKPQATPLPQAAETTDAYTEVAARGESVTKLARRSAARYLEANPQDFEVTNEHRIYVEDFLKDQTKRAPLSVGGTRSFSKNTIREAVEASQKLTDAQLQHLQKYSKTVRW